MSVWFGYLVILVVLLLALEAGFRVAGVPRLRLTADQRSQVSGVLAALLAVLGFVLAFSVSIVESRFAARKALVLAEANAIGTAFLRTDFLPADERARSRALLRHYVDLRVGVTVDRLDAALRESEGLHGKLWTLAARAAQARPGSIPLGYYIDALNEVIDLQQARVTAAVRNRLPRSFFVLLYGTAVLSIAVLGFSTGQTGSRNLVATLALIVVLGALLQLVADLDRPDMHLARVGQGAMEDLRDSLHSTPASVP